MQGRSSNSAVIDRQDRNASQKMASLIFLSCIFLSCARNDDHNLEPDQGMRRRNSSCKVGGHGWVFQSSALIKAYEAGESTPGRFPATGLTDECELPTFSRDGPIFLRANHQDADVRIPRWLISVQQASSARWLLWAWAALHFIGPLTPYRRDEHQWLQTARRVAATHGKNRGSEWSSDQSATAARVISPS